MATTSTTNTASASVQSTVYALMANDRIPLQRLQSQKSELESKSKEYQGLGSKLSSLLTLSKSFAMLGSQNPLRAVSISGGDASTFAVTTDGTAQRGSHTVEILNIATRHAIASEAVATENDGGEAAKARASGESRFRITVGGETHAFSVDLENGLSQGEALSRIAAAINGGDGSVNANVIAQGDGLSRLVLQSASTGEAARITEVEDLEGTWMADLGLAGREIDGLPLSSTVQAAADAHLRLDGVDVSSAENTVRSVVPGLTIELHAPSSAVAVRVAQDADSVVKNIQDFMTKYNAAVDEIRSLTQAADESGNNRGVFAGDVSVSRLRTALREAVALPIDGSSLRSLADVGLTTDRTGHLELSDENKLRSVLDADPESFETILTGSNGVASRLAKLVEAYSPSGAIYTRQLSSWRTQSRSLEARITQESKRLSRRQQVLTEQIAALQSSQSALSTQQSYLSGLLSSSDSLFY